MAVNWEERRTDFPEEGYMLREVIGEVNSVALTLSVKDWYDEVQYYSTMKELALPYMQRVLKILAEEG